MRSDLKAKESEYLRLRRAKLTLTDFEYIKTIGRGAFGEVLPHTVVKELRSP